MKKVSHPTIYDQQILNETCDNVQIHKYVYTLIHESSIDIYIYVSMNRKQIYIYIYTTHTLTGSEGLRRVKNKRYICIYNLRSEAYDFNNYIIHIIQAIPNASISESSTHKLASHIVIQLCHYGEEIAYFINKSICLLTPATLFIFFVFLWFLYKTPLCWMCSIWQYLYRAFELTLIVIYVVIHCFVVNSSTQDTCGDDMIERWHHLP